MSSRGGSASSAAIARAVSGTRRRDRFVFGYGVRRPFANLRCTVRARPNRSTSRRSRAIHSSGRSPVSAATDAASSHDPRYAPGYARHARFRHPRHTCPAQLSQVRVAERDQMGGTGLEPVTPSLSSGAVGGPPCSLSLVVEPFAVFRRVRLQACNARRLRQITRDLGARGNLVPKRARGAEHRRISREACISPRWSCEHMFVTAEADCSAK